MGIVEIHGINTNDKTLRYSKSYNCINLFSGNDMVFGSNSFKHLYKSIILSINIDEFKLYLKYDKLSSPWKATQDTVIIKNKHNKFIAWLVEQPSSDISGTLSINKSEKKISGYGYHDIIDMNIPPWGIPIKSLYWGRALMGTYNVTFNIIVSGEGKIRKYLMIQRNGLNITQPDSFNITASANETEITGSNFCLKLKHVKEIENSEIVNQNRISSALIRFFLSFTSGKPVEKKYYSTAQLRYENNVVFGDAIHEFVLWNGGQLHESL